MKPINEIYEQILKDVYYTGVETSPRDMKIKELLGYSFECDPNDNVITLKGFETNLDYAKLELDWYLAATNRIDWHPKIEKVWKKYSDDGQHVNSSYGHRIFGAHQLFPNQWKWVKEKLSEDSDSRQAVININNPSDKAVPTKDFPCTMYIQVFVRDNKLEWITNMRSNDVYFGLRNDLFCFTELQKRLASELELEVGTYRHFSGSMHLYEKQFKKVEELFKFDYFSKFEYEHGLGPFRGLPKDGSTDN